MQQEDIINPMYSEFIIEKIFLTNDNHRKQRHIWYFLSAANSWHTQMNCHGICTQCSATITLVRSTLYSRLAAVTMLTPKRES